MRPGCGGWLTGHGIRDARALYRCPDRPAGSSRELLGSAREELEGLSVAAHGGRECYATGAAEAGAASLVAVIARSPRWEFRLLPDTDLRPALEEMPISESPTTRPLVSR
jgi:hypothetical protein